LRNSLIFIIGFLLSMLVAGHAAASFLHFDAALPSVAKGVSYCVFRGASKTRELRAFWLSILVIGVLATLAAYLCRASIGEKRAAWRDKPFAIVCFLLVFFGFALLMLPDGEAILRASEGAEHAFHYDALNLISWQYFLFQGKLPYRDFWYPYGNMFYLAGGPLAPLRSALFLSYAHNLFTVAALLFATCRLTRYSAFWGLGLIASVYALPAAGFAADIIRYLPPMVVLLLFESDWKSPGKFSRLVLFLYSSWSYLLDPLTLIYTLSSLSVLLAVRICERVPLVRLRRGVINAALPIAPFSLYLLWLYDNQAWPGFSRFILSLSDAASYGMYPPALQAWLDGPDSLPSSLLWSIFALAFVTVFRSVSKFRNKSSLPALSIALCALCFFLFQKQLIRPHMAFQIVMLPAFGLAWSLYEQVEDSKSERTSLFASGVFTALVFFVLSGGFEGGGLSFFTLASEIKGSKGRLESLLYSPDRWGAAKKSYFRIDALHVGRGEQSGSEFFAEVESRLHLQLEDKIFVLGDEPYVYLALSKECPYFLTLYNQSLLEDQFQTLRWLELHKPKYVFFDPEKKSFDGVPNVVRTPLLFQYVASHYVPETTVGVFKVLRERGEQEQPAREFWAETLGRSIDLGFIPAASMIPVRGKPNEGGTPVLLVSIEHPQGGRKRKIGLGENDSVQAEERFSFEFREDESLHEYGIRLDRLWYWPLLNEQERALRCKSEGTHCEIRFIDNSEQSLY